VPPMRLSRWRTNIPTSCLATTSSLCHSSIVSQSPTFVRPSCKPVHKVALTTGSAARAVRRSVTLRDLGAVEGDYASGGTGRCYRQMVLRQRNVWGAHATLSSRIRRVKWLISP
jgi:hypothetical protein